MAQPFVSTGDLPPPEQVATGLPFNSAAAIERRADGRTNPMVNPGAIATVSFAGGFDPRGAGPSCSPVAATGGAASEIDKAKQLLDSNAITQAEFDSIKAKALA